MSIFPKKKISVGDLVIGASRYGWKEGVGAAMLKRYFTEPSLVIEIKENEALVFFEQTGPEWYDITKLERVYVSESEKQRSVAKD